MPKATIRLNVEMYRQRKRVFAMELSKLFLEMAAAHTSILKDLELAVIAHTIALIAVGNVLKRSDGTADYRDLNVIVGDAQRGATPFAIAEATGLPRTTVLRKIRVLVEYGLIKAAPAGGFVFVPGKIQAEPYQSLYDRQARLIVKIANDLLAAEILEVDLQPGV